MVEEERKSKTGKENTTRNSAREKMIKNPIVKIHFKSSGPKETKQKKHKKSIRISSMDIKPRQPAKSFVSLDLVMYTYT